MSGGFFDYDNHKLDTWAKDIYDYVAQHKNELDPKCTAKIFLTAADLCRVLSALLHRVDYLIEGDDSEEDFYRRLHEDICNLPEMHTSIGLHALVQSYLFILENTEEKK